MSLPTERRTLNIGALATPRPPKSLLHLLPKTDLNIIATSEVQPLHSTPVDTDLRIDGGHGTILDFEERNDEVINIDDIYLPSPPSIIIH